MREGARREWVAVGMMGDPLGQCDEVEAHSRIRATWARWIVDSEPGCRLNPIPSRSYDEAMGTKRNAPAGLLASGFALLAGVWLATGCHAASGPSDPSGLEADDAVSPVLQLAVRTSAGQEGLASMLRTSRMLRWLGEREEVALAVGPEAEGDILVHAVQIGAPGISASTTAMLRELEASLPVRFGDRSLELAGSHYAATEHTLSLRLPSTSRREEWVVAGGAAEQVADRAGRAFFRHLPGFSRRQGPEGDYQVYQSPYLSRTGRWGPRDEVGRLTVDAGHEEDQMREREEIWEAKVPIARAGLILRVPPLREREPALTKLAEHLGQAVVAQASRIPLGLDEPMTVIVEDDYVSLGRFTNAIGAAVLRHDRKDDRSRAEVHLVYRQDDRFAYRFVLAKALLARAGLAETRPWLQDGAALWLSRDWYGKSYDQWLPLLASGEVLPTAAELAVEERQRHATSVLWAPVVAALIDALPGNDLRTKLAAWPNLSEIDRMLAQIADRRVAATSPTRPKAWKQAFWAGVSLAAAPGLESGYHAPGLDRKLARLAELGVNGVSLMPFASQADPQATTLRILRRSPSSENDIGMLEAARRARGRGFRVLWKPHLWLGGGSWPGDIEMASQADWDAWFRAYRLYILHNAVLAEWAKVELFSVGVELGKTLGQEASWRHLITSVRRIFRQPVTYSGNWWEDYDRIPFADLLDVVGVDAYFPLASGEDASDSDLAAGARRAMDQLAAASARFDKPLLLTEVGFSATRGAWIAPHTEGAGGDTSVLSEDDQKRAYAALLGTLGKPHWLGGMFVWKAFSMADSTPGTSPDFRFIGRPAEAEIARYFTAPTSE